MMSATDFKSFNGILAGPVPLLGRALIMSSISLSEIWARMKSVWFLFFRNLSGDMFGTLGTVFSVTGPTFTKKLLKLLEIALGSSMIDPFTLS